jgi:outer membrane protein OmpA-like peptidoglycan-associated protein
MAYVRIPEADSALGSFGCGAGCGCHGCRKSARNKTSGLGERYEREEAEVSPATPLMRIRPSAPALSGWGRFGEALPRPRGPMTGGLQLRMPAFATITGFTPGGASLRGSQLESIRRTAEFIARSWTGAAMVTSVRVTGYIDARESQADLGQRRAIAVRDALLGALDVARPGLATRLRWITEDRGLSDAPKVEIYLWVGPTAMPVPPLVRVPSPAEAARRIAPTEPETVAQRIERILKTLPPTLQRRSFSEMFWKEVDESLNSTMSRIRVPPSLRGPIRSAAHAALERGAESVLTRALDETDFGSEAKDAIRASVRAAAKTR